MCGIAGIMGPGNKPGSAAEIHSMCSVMVHRGPDDEGIHTGPGIGLGMRRLSIIDLEGGRQPMRNEDGTVFVVANGEIYNFKALRLDLERRGHRFASGSDTEVIVHLYEEYGPDCVEHLRGMFGLAIWDARRRQLVLARDRLGIKPLYYTQTPTRLAFASELKCLLQLGDVPRELNLASVDHLFAALSTPAGDSILTGVRKLEPGHVLVARADREPVLRRYWDVKFEADRDHDESWFVERLRALLEESVRLHMVSDVPLGAFLSGGIDSSAVVATMAGLSDRPVNTFSIGFREPKYDESGQARRFANQLGTEHRQLILEADALDVLDDITWHLDEPFGDSSAIPTYLVSKLASEHVTVVLSGDGGDELFAGYDKYVKEGRERRFDRIPAFLRRGAGAVGAAMPDGWPGRRFLQHLALTGDERYLDSCRLLDLGERRQLLHPDARAQLIGDVAWDDLEPYLLGEDHPWLSRIQYLDLHRYLPLDILTKVDRMSMAHSIEVRVPLLDHKLVEFAATIPPELKLKNGTTKSIFKEAMRGIVPDEVIDRPKRGFAVPLGDWFRGHLADYVRDLLLSATSRARRVIDPTYVEHLLRLHAAGRPMDMQLWTLISFELWCRRFLDTAAPQLAHEERRYAQR